MEKENLIKKSGLYLIGNMSSKILTVMLIPIYTYFINTETLGRYDYALTLINIITPIAFVAIWEAILKFLLSTSEEQHGKFIASSVVFSFIAAIIMGIGVVIYFSFVEVDVGYEAMFIVVLVIQGFSQIWQYYARALKANVIYVQSGIIATIINFLSIILLICIFKLELIGLYISYLLGQISILLIIERKVKVLRYVKKNNVHLSIIKSMIIFSVPLVINLVSLWLISGFGKIMIVRYLGATENGLYSFAIKFSQIIMVFGSVVTMALIEEAISKKNEPGFPQKFSKTIEKLFEIFQMIGIVAIPIIFVFYELVKYTDYYISRYYVPILIFYSILMVMSTNVGSVFQVIGKTNIIFTTTVAGGFVTVVISYAGIHALGIYAVLAGQFFGAFIMIFLRYIVAKKYIAIHLNFKPVIFRMLIFIGLSIVCSKIDVLGSFFVSISTIAISAFAYRKLVANMVVEVKKKLCK
ncbi:oligosaccharide flippase family protein [Caldifermentibacillus hisashii]|uniref:lipopolysaccharide biosynthesis protein n=1 Tax=Caldifermentibacillus hisashii TaxID=996558 RepID=UPI0030D6C6AC